VCCGELTLLIRCIYIYICMCVCVCVCEVCVCMCVCVCVCFMFVFFSYFVTLLKILTSFTSLLALFSALLIFTMPVVAAACAVNIYMNNG